MVEANLQFEQDSAVARQGELKNEIRALEYRLSMGEQKVRAILGRHKTKMHQKITESLKNGWKTWSTQATNQTTIVASQLREWEKKEAKVFTRWMKLP